MFESSRSKKRSRVVCAANFTEKGHPWLELELMRTKNKSIQKQQSFGSEVVNLPKTRTNTSPGVLNCNRLSRECLN